MTKATGSKQGPSRHGSVDRAAPGSAELVTGLLRGLPLNQLMGFTNDAVFFRALDGQILEVNRRACQLTGRTRQELIGSNVRKLTPATKEDLTRARRAMTEVRRRGHVVFEHRLQHASGQIRPVEISARLVDRRRGIVLSMVRDISPRKREQEALRQSEERLQAIITSMQDTAVTVLDGEGRFQFVHLPAVFRRQMRLSPAWMLGQTLGQVFSPAQARVRLAVVRKVLRTGRPEFLELSFEYGRGTLWYESSILPIHDAGGNVAGVLVASRDVTQRRLAQQALQESQEQLSAIFRSLHGVAVIVLDRNGTYQLAQIPPEMQQRYGQTPEQLRGKTLYDYFSAQEAGNRVRLIGRVFRTGQASRNVLLSPHAKGKFWQEITYSPIRDERGRITAVLSMVRDIHDQKQDQDALRESRARLEYLIDNTSDIIFQMDLKGNFIFSNRSARRLLGYSVRQLLKMNMFEVAAPEYHEMLRDRLQRRIAGKRLPQPFEYDVLSSKERRIRLEVSTSPVYRQGTLVAVQGMARDITARKQAEDALRESERRMRLVLEHSTDGINIIECNPQSLHPRLVMCNDRYVEMSGRTREELMRSDNLDEFFIAVSKPSDPRQQKRRLLRGEAFSGVASWVRPDGKENYFEWTGAPFWVGKKLYVVGIDRDVTERRRQEKALEEAQARLATAREEERRHLAGELHDSLGQGLVALQLAIRGLSSAPDPSGETTGRTHNKAAALVDNLIAEVRAICHGLYPPTLESLGLYFTLVQLSRDFPHANVEVQWRAGGTSARFGRAAEIALFRIAQEALSNAVRHSRADHISIAVDCQDGRAILTVRDNGGGFDVGKASGKGLGLSKMRERAETAGGEFSIKSSPRGTIVRAGAATTIHPAVQS